MGKFDKDSLGTRMKEYEANYKQKTVSRIPIVIRIDGKAFHTFTRGFKKPFDELLMDTMQQTTLSLCKDLQNCKFGYTQSDEITLVFTIDDVIKTQEIYDGKVNKILSICASKATRYFNKIFFDNVKKLENGDCTFKEVVDVNVYKKKLFEAEFDCRVMNIPDFDVINNLIWRQQDATRNSIQMLGQANFSHKELQGKNCSDIQDMLVLQKGINWNDLEVAKKRGACMYRKKEDFTDRKKWVLDLSMPILTEDSARTWFNEIIFPNKKDEA